MKHRARVDRAERRLSDQFGEDGEWKCEWAPPSASAHYCQRMDLTTMYGAIAAHDAPPGAGLGWRFVDETMTAARFEADGRQCSACPLHGDYTFTLPDWADPEGLKVGQLRARRPSDE